MAADEHVRVLIVEDDEDDFVIARDMLGEQDRTRFEVEWAANPDQARRAFREGQHDVYLVDQRLGPVTGLDLVREVFREESHPPVIMLTGYDDYVVDLEATMLGVTDFLIKGQLDPEMLERSIRYAVRHHAMLNELRESQDRYALAVKGANDGIWDWDLVDDRVYFAPRWKAILGYAEDEIGDSPDEWFGRVNPDDVMRLRAAIDDHLEGRTEAFEREHRIRHASGRYLWVLSRGVAVRDVTGKAIRLAGSMSDISGRKRAEERLLHDARHDSLTGLPNRATFLDHLELSLSRAKRRPDYSCAVLFCDLNRFKLVNDTFSHGVGDELLIALARRLSGAMRPGDTVARFGGDEFTILLDDVESPEAALDVARRIGAAVEQPFAIEGRNLVVTASTGIAVGGPESNAADLVQHADIAMYEAKRAGEGATVFTEGMRTRMAGELRLEVELRDAIERRTLRVFYQPIVELETGRIAGFEALARWPSEPERDVAPVEFIRVAESTGLIRALGLLVLERACSQLSAWRRADLVDDGVTMGVNMSARQLGDADLLDDVVGVLRESGLPAEALRLEITEGTIMREPERMPIVLRELGSIGIGADIDDFGTGYSSLAMLGQFAGNNLKIDRSFISSMCEDEGSAEIVRTIIDLAEHLDLGVIAEGIETEEQLSTLRRLGGSFAQGFLFARPTDAEGIGSMLRSWRPKAALAQRDGLHAGLMGRRAALRRESQPR